MSVFRFKRFSVCSDGAAMKVGTDGVLLGCCCLLPGEWRADGAANDVADGVVVGAANDAADDVADGVAGGAAGGGLPVKVLDIGTGTGLVSLLVANRLSDKGLPFDITGIDIDDGAAVQAQENFEASPWKGNLHSIHASLNDFAKSGFESCGSRGEGTTGHCDSNVAEGLETGSTPGISGRDKMCPVSGKYDIIVCNPPFYDNSLPAKGDCRNVARHSLSLSFRDVLDFASPMIGGALASEGTLSLILPASDETFLLRYAFSVGLRLLGLQRIRTVPRKSASRIVAHFSPSISASAAGPFIEEFAILNPDGSRSERYISLTGDFYL